jgi:hypothetical protein
MEMNYFLFIPIMFGFLFIMMKCTEADNTVKQAKHLVIYFGKVGYMLHSRNITPQIQKVQPKMLEKV